MLVLTLVDRGTIEAIDSADDFAGLVQSFIDGGAFEDEPGGLLASHCTITDDSGHLIGVIRYAMPSVQARVYGGEVWPYLVVEHFGPVDRQSRYRRIDNGPDEVYGCERID